MKRILMMTAAMFVATAAAAAITPESVVDTFKADGYGSIEVKVGPNQIKAEAIKDGTKVEVVYDKETGAILKQESEAAGAAADTVEIKFEDKDFVKGGGDDSTDDNGTDSDDDSDDDSSGHGSGGNSGSGGGGSSGSGGSGGGNSGSGGGGSGNSGSGGGGSGNSGSGNSGSGG